MRTPFLIKCHALGLHSETGKLEDPSSYRDMFMFPRDRKSNPNSRIIGGEEVTPHAFPFQAALLTFTRSEIYFCGGSLISDRYVLTAAHCVVTNPNPALYVLVQLGAHDISVEEDHSVVYNATEWLYHSEWDESILQNDVALIKLPSRVNLNSYIQTVPYANGSNLYEQSPSTVIGWGQTETSISVSSVLRSVNTTIISNQQCAAADNALGQLIKDTHVCISGDGIKGTCSGDSGGPLLVNGVQVGIVSFGFVNCTMGMPSIFTRVTAFSDWIQEYSTDGASSFQNLYYSLIVSLVLSLYHLSKNV